MNEIKETIHQPEPNSRRQHTTRDFYIRGENKAKPEVWVGREVEEEL